MPVVAVLAVVGSVFGIIKEVKEWKFLKDYERDTDKEKESTAICAVMEDNLQYREESEYKLVLD